MADVNPYDSIVASMPAPGANPYDAVVANLASSSGAKASLVAAQGSNPDATARALKVSAGLGVPVDVAERNLADFEAIDKVNQYDAVLRSSPAMLKRWLAEPVNARLVGDDLPVLAGQASLWRGLADIGRSAASGVVGFAGSALTGTGEAYDVAARTVGRIAGAAGVPSTGVALPWYLDPAQILKRPGRTITAFADEIGVPRERENLVDQVAQGVGQIGGQLAALMATGGAGGLLMLFGQGVDQMADDVQKSGKAGTIAGDATLIGGGMLTAIAEKTGLDLLVNRLPPAIRNKLARTVVDLAAAGGIEAAEEAIEKIGQNALSNYYLGTHKSLLDGTLDAAIPAGGAAAVVRGMLLGGGRLRRRQLPDPEQPAADAAALDQVMETARGSGLATRSPAKLAELLASMGDGGNVYVPADAVRTYFQNLDPQEVQQQARALGIDGQIEQAMATGGDVVIPLHQYVAHAPDEMAAAWHDDLRLRSAGMSINEAKTFKGGAKELGDAVAGRLDQTSREDAAREEVIATVERQLQAAGESPEAARQIAQLYGARYATRATRLGQGDAVSQYGRSGVSVRSDLPEVIRHAPADDIELLIRALKSKRAGGVDDRKGPTILQFIAREGGIIDDAGELASRDLGKWHIGKPFQRKALREAPQPKDGGLPGLAPGAGDRSYYDADAWALRLWENGYFPEHTERPEVGDLYEAIDQELRGKPRYVEQQGRTWQSDFNAVLAEADELLNRAGIDARKASADEIRKAFTDPDGRGYEQAVYHGSPHVFDKFTLDHIGSGEGAQAYGWGLYFASNKAVAKYYREGLASEVYYVDGKEAGVPSSATPKGFALAVVSARGFDGALARLDQLEAEGAKPDFLADRRVAVEALRGKKVERRLGGRLYHVEIPDDGAYLNWDKPFAEQSETVKSALRSLWAEKGGNPDAARPWTASESTTGQSIYAAIATSFGGSGDNSATQKAASLALFRAGIPGIQYLDAGSRNAVKWSISAPDENTTGKWRVTQLGRNAQTFDTEAEARAFFDEKNAENHNYVLFDDAQAVIKQYEQASGKDTPRGNIVFSQDEEGRTRSLITLFKDRNLSTVLHETGHLWTEELLADAALPNAPEQIRADAATLRAYLGAEGDAPLTVEQHEKMARTVEAYFMEGKSPSVALSAVLARFKAWMMSIYKTIRGLEVEINDDIRGVLDRMIATDEAIAEAQTEIHARQLFASADQAGMTEAEYQAYTESVARSREVAEHDVLAKLMDDVRRKLTAQWEAETDALREEVQPTVDTQPDILALRYLRDGTLPDSLAHLRELPRLRLSREALIEEYGNPEIVNALPKSVPPLTVERGGVRPAEIAELLGFRDGRSMIDALTALGKEQEALKQAGDKRSVRAKRTDDEVDRVMIERHGPVLTDGSIEAEALSALHNDARADVLAAELRALARKAGKDAPPYKLARDWARRTIAEKPVGEISDLSQYTRAESRAGFAALEAATKGDADEALRRKQEQMIAHALWMEARDAKERVETARRKMDRLAGARTLKAMDQDYLEKIHALLERFDLKPRSMRDVERAESLRQWADAQQIAGIDVAVPEKLLDEAYRTNYRRMTVEEFQGLSDSVDQLAHLGRMKQKFLDHKEQREFDEVVEEAVDAAGQGRQSGDTTTDIGKTNFQRRFGAVVSRLRSADAALLKVEYLFNWLDGEKAGPFTRLFQRMSDAQAGEKTQWTDIGSKLRAIFHELPVETRRRLQDVAVYPELNGESLRRDALIAVALNMGNESNKEKMLKGHKWTEDGVLRAIDRGLGKEEMAFVQKTWDLIETLWPQIAAMERRVNGVAPEKVERSELVTRHGTFKGGYYPMVYESKREAQKGDRTDALTAENFGAEVYTRATTPKGFTKQRVEGFNRPVHLSLEVIPQHLMEVVHDLHWREPIMAAQRFLNDARIKNAIRQKMGREYEAQLQPWLNHMALEYARDRQGMAGWDRFMKGLRTNMTMVGMGYRLTTIFSQIGGFSDSTSELGTRWMASGFKAYAAHPIDSIAFVRDRSGEMRHRADNLDRDIRKATREMVGQDSVLDPVRDFAFKGVAWADAAVTIPTWLGGYNKALHDGKTEAEAVQYADSMVRRSQGASGSKDMVRLQTSGEAGKLITMFYSYFSHYYNAQRDVARRFIDAESPGDFADALARAFWLNGPGVLAAGLLAGQGPGEDESWAAWAARTMFFNLFMGVPIARDIASEVSNAVAGKFVGGYQLSPVSRVLDTGVRVAFDAANLIQGDPATRAVSHTINLMGYLTALPTGQAATTMQFLYDALWSGSARPEGVTDWLKGVVYGSPPKK
ncbi:MAG: hypothetical protein KIS73_29015 [Enhydrobacter sp.]|nr:hypothetical protein [Enhydrobacter sp.]